MRGGLLYSSPRHASATARSHFSRSSGDALADLDAVCWDPAGRRLAPTDERLQSQRLHLLETRFGRLDLMREIGHG